MGIPAMIKSMFLSRPGALGQRRMVAAFSYLQVGSPWTLFTITGGNILITALYAETTQIEAAASVGQVSFDPAGVGAGINWDDGTCLYAAQIGEITLVPMDVGFPAVVAVACAAPAWPYNYICPPGGIEFTVTVADMTGAIEWYLFFIPLDPEAVVA